MFKTKEKKSEEEIKDDYRKFIEYIKTESKVINYDFFKDYSNFVVPSALAKELYGIKNKNKNNKLVNVIKSGLSDLKDKIKEMSEDEKKKKIEQTANILKIVEEILEFNKQNQPGKGLNILTPNQMLIRLPISIAQLKSGNNSEKLRNEIRQILYFFVQIKKTDKTTL